MKAAQPYLLLNLILSSSVVVDMFNPWGYFYESCDSNWISFNATGLKHELENNVFGQHIASPLILNVVNGFMSQSDPKKPLVLSLNGPTGTGKNFISSLIAKNIYKKGMDSSFVHVFTSLLHFPHKDNIETYKSQLREWIQTNVTKCERSMFIFDEMDKMHPGLIDTITPFLNYYNKLDGVSYRKAIFIFLSNTGAELITQLALKFWQEGRDREEIKLSDLEREICEIVFNSDSGGFWHSHLIKQKMLDFFVPFLPLEHKHVVQCIMARMTAVGQQQNQTVAEKVARNLQYFPKFERVFSVTGCKAVHNRMFYDDDVSWTVSPLYS